MVVCPTILKMKIQTSVKVGLARTRKVCFEDEGTVQPYRITNIEFSSRPILREDEPVSPSGDNTELHEGLIDALQAELDNLLSSEMCTIHVDTDAFRNCFHEEVVVVLETSTASRFLPNPFLMYPQHEQVCQWKRIRNK